MTPELNVKEDSVEEMPAMFCFSPGGQLHGFLLYVYAYCMCVVFHINNAKRKKKMRKSELGSKGFFQYEPSTEF